MSVAFIPGDEVEEKPPPEMCFFRLKCIIIVKNWKNKVFMQETFAQQKKSYIKTQGILYKF
jgi:hypothetical protein